MSVLNPEKLTEQIAEDLSDDIVDSIVLIGSLAAAYHYRDVIGLNGVQTKDADLLIYPPRLKV